jgi:hypothetical protein
MGTSGTSGAQDISASSRQAPGCSVAQAQGMSSSRCEAGQRLTSLVRTSVRQACGSTPQSLQVSISEAMQAQFSAP